MHTKKCICTYKRYDACSGLHVVFTTFLIQIVFNFIILTISLTLRLFRRRHDIESFVSIHRHEANFQIRKADAPFSYA